nr:uncharacterized protein LOC109158743 [Ipomoea batatas]
MDMEAEEPNDGVHGTSTTIEEENNIPKFGALDNLDENNELEESEEDFYYERSDGPTGAILTAKGKRPQVQISEAQINNDTGEHQKGSDKGYEQGKTVVRTMITEEGNFVEETQSQNDDGTHHQDSPDDKEVYELKEDGEESMNNMAIDDGPSSPTFAGSV